MPLPININAKSLDNDKGSSSVLKRKIEALSEKRVENFSQLVGNLPVPGEMYALWTIKQFNAFSMIMTIINSLGNIDFLAVSSYNISRKSVYAFHELLSSGKIKQMDLYVSDVAKSMFPKAFEALNEINARTPNLNVNYVWNHSKVAIIQCADNYFVCEGSGNFSNNARHEQYILINDQKFHEFRKSNFQSMSGK